jgi:hypothetical protein
LFHQHSTGPSSPQPAARFLATCHSLAPSGRSSEGPKLKKIKKGAAILVQSAHNSFTINEISKKNESEKRAI